AWGPGKGRGRFSSGLLLVSRHPVTASHAMRFSRCSGTDCTANKGAVHARIAIDGLGELDFFTTHLNAGRGRAAERVRDAQLRELAAFVALHAAEGRPYVLTGDFNFDPRSGAYRKLMGWLGLRDAHAEHVAANPGLDPVEAAGFTMD